MNRYDFQSLSKLRLKEGKILFDEGFYDGAHYLLGYALECALKACIARSTNRYDFPPDKRVVAAVYNHNLTNLVNAAGLGKKHEVEMKENREFSNNWNVVKDWTPEMRYQIGKSQVEVSDFHKAIISKRNGVLVWLKMWW